MPNSENRYVVLGVYWADNPDTPEFLAVEGKIVVFDTLWTAQSFVPLLGSGRATHWDAAKEDCRFSPLVRRGFNRIAIFTGYDPHDVPNGFRAKGIYSESATREWKNHMHWGEALTPLQAWADKLNEEAFTAPLLAAA
jgi:hypothetical protein